MIGNYNPDEVKQALSLADHLTPVLLVALGKPDETIVLTEVGRTVPPIITAMKTTCIMSPSAACRIFCFEEGMRLWTVRLLWLALREERAPAKTTLATKLKAAYREDALILSHDFYYRANTEIPFEERVKRNYDHPDAFDTDQMITDVKKLKNFQAVDHPEYSFVTHSRTGHTVHVEPAPVIILEGILIFANEQLRDLMDIKVFVDADADIRLIRRLLRDVKERGRSMGFCASAVHEYGKTDA